MKWNNLLFHRSWISNLRWLITYSTNHYTFSDSRFFDSLTASNLYNWIRLGTNTMFLSTDSSSKMDSVKWNRTTTQNRKFGNWWARILLSEYKITQMEHESKFGSLISSLGVQDISSVYVFFLAQEIFVDIYETLRNKLNSFGSRGRRGVYEILHLRTSSDSLACL